MVETVVWGIAGVGNKTGRLEKVYVGEFCEPIKGIATLMVELGEVIRG